MIAFFDTSALVKLFIDELQCDAARAWASQARAIVVSQLAWVEFHAAMALKRRTLQRPVVEIAQAREQFAQSWALWQRAGVDAALATSAGELAWRHGLRAYDSVQLATALKAAEPDMTTVLIQPQAATMYEDIIDLMDSFKKHGMIDLGVSPL